MKRNTLARDERFPVLASQTSLSHQIRSIDWSHSPREHTPLRQPRRLRNGVAPELYQS